MVNLVVSKLFWNTSAISCNTTVCVDCIVILANYYIINSVIFFYTFRCLECEGEFCNECHTGENQQNHLVTPALGLPVILSGNRFFMRTIRLLRDVSLTHFFRMCLSHKKKVMIMALQETLNIYVQLIYILIIFYFI